MRLARPTRDERPAVFGFRASLAEIGVIARLMRHYGFEVTVPERVSPTQWRARANVPATLSAARLLRFCNLIDRTPVRSFALLTTVNVRVFHWLGRDRRQPPHFYRARRSSYGRRLD